MSALTPPRPGQRPPPGSGDYEPGFGLPDQEVLAEISHELGNYFHKLYYWTDFLKSRCEPESDEMASWRMLDDNVEGLEAFLKMTLEYFAPARLSFTRIPLGDLLDGAESYVPGRRVHIEGLEHWRGTDVMADPARFHHVMRTIFERVAESLSGDDELVIRLRPSSRDEFDGVEIEFVAGHAYEGPGSLVGGIAMSVAEKFLKVHGGEFCERNDNESRALTMFLPLYG